MLFSRAWNLVTTTGSAQSFLFRIMWKRLLVISQYPSLLLHQRTPVFSWTIATPPKAEFPRLPAMFYLMRYKRKHHQGTLLKRERLTNKIVSSCVDSSLREIRQHWNNQQRHYKDTSVFEVHQLCQMLYAAFWGEESHWKSFHLSMQ